MIRCRYNQKIEQLKREMTEATSSTAKIQEEIENLPNRFGYVEAEQRCVLSGQPLLDNDFFLFPCGHAFIADRMTLEMQKYQTISGPRYTLRPFARPFRQV